MRQSLLKKIIFASTVCLIAQPVALSSKELRGRGDFDFYLDKAVFQRPEGKVQEVYIRVSNSELKFKSSGDKFHAKLSFNIVITRADGGGKRIEDAFTLDIFEKEKEKTESPLDFQTVIKKYDLSPGKFTLSCTIEDLHAQKATVMGMVRGKHKSSTIRHVVLNVPSFEPDWISVSDPMFLLAAEVRDGLPVYHPNPTRLYGLYKDTLEVYMEVYLPDSLGESEAVLFDPILLDEKGEVVKKSRIQLPTQGSSSKVDQQRDLYQVYPILFREDLTTLDAGSYTLYANIRLGDRLVSRFRCGNFSVAWDLRTWESTRRTYLAEARFLLGDKDFEIFLAKSIGEQEQMLQAMWKEVDPYPHTGVNEAYEIFLDRLDYVNAHYSDYGEGSFSDRGLIYLKYGEPDEVIVEVVPLNRESVSDAFEKVENRYHPISFSTHGTRAATRGPNKDIIVDPRRIAVVGEGGNVAYPYELWIYNNKGDAILERDQVLGADIGLRFIFIDREGYGRYKLESSSSMTDK